MRCFVHDLKRNSSPKNEFQSLSLLSMLMKVRWSFTVKQHCSSLPNNWNSWGHVWNINKEWKKRKECTRFSRNYLQHYYSTTLIWFSSLSCWLLHCCPKNFANTWQSLTNEDRSHHQDHIIEPQRGQQPASIPKRDLSTPGWSWRTPAGGPVGPSVHFYYFIVNIVSSVKCSSNKAGG